MRSSQPLSQPHAQQRSSEREHNNLYAQTQVSSQNQLIENSEGTESLRTCRYSKPILVSDLAKKLPKTLADKFQSDSEEGSDSESEEDPDDELIEALAAARGVRSRDHEDQATTAVDAADAERNAQDEDSLPASSVLHRPASKVLESSSTSNATSPSQPHSNEDAQIKIYTVRSYETEEGKELAESAGTLYDREEANTMAREMVKDYRLRADYEERSFSTQLKDRLYHGKVIFDDENSFTVEVTSELSLESKYTLDVSKMNTLHGEQVWVVTQELKKTIIDAAGHKETTCFKEDAGDAVYTDRGYANYWACEELIQYLKPPKKYEAEFEADWANSWCHDIRGVLQALKGTEELFDVELEMAELGELEWLAWDKIRYRVEARKTKGPRN